MRKFESKKNKNIVYHVGDFSRKAFDTDLFHLNIGRSTGFFGTGHYFCTEWEYCANQGDGHRPLYQIDISNYKLLYGDYSLHDALKWLNKYISQYPLTKNNQDDWWKLLYHYHEFYSYWDSDYDDFGEYLKYDFEFFQKDGFCETFSEYINDDYQLKHFIELCYKFEGLDVLADELKSDKPNYKLITEITKSSIFLNNDIYEQIRKIVNDKRLKIIDLGVSEKKFDSICEDIYLQLKKYYVKDGYLNRSSVPKDLDSIPTRFIKTLGYDGIIPSKECDNITYGGVIYDLDLRDTKLLADDVSKFEGIDLIENKLFEKLSFSQLKSEIVPDSKSNAHLKYFYNQRNQLNGQGNRNIKFLTSVFDENDGSMLFTFRTNSTYTDEPKKELINDNNNDGSLKNNVSNEYLLQLKICDFFNILDELITTDDTNFTKEDMKAILELSEEVRIGCGCPSSYWMGGDYWLSQIDAQLKYCDIKPKFWNDPSKRGETKVCKHELSLLNHISFFLPQMAMACKKELKNYGLL